MQTTTSFFVNFMRSVTNNFISLHTQIKTQINQWEINLKDSTSSDALSAMS